MLTYVEEHPFIQRLLGYLLLAVALFCICWVVFSLVSDGALWVFGHKTAAQVVESWTEQTSSEGSREVTFDYFIRYEFETQKGQQLSATSKVGASEWVGVGYGQQGSVRHDVMDGQAQQAAAPVVFQDQKHITEYTTGGLDEGRTVEIVYLPLFPSHNRLDDSRFVSLLACAYLPFAVVGGIVGILGWRLVRSSALDPAEEAIT